jgi:hypothetical protein
MNSTPQAQTGGKDQRERLEKSFEKSTEPHPETFKDEANEDKQVEIGPDPTKKPIKGIDPPERPGR